jgi:hypothetical protein
MNRIRWFVMLTIVAVAAALTLGCNVEAAPDWSIKADVAESCSCNPVCPCLFGSPATAMPCEGSRLIDIETGHYNGVQLDGIPVVATFSMGKWVKYYVGEKASDEQVEAVVELLRASQGFSEWKTLSAEKVPVTIERGDGRLKFAAATSTVEIEAMKGADGGPVTIANMPVPFLLDYTQHVSVVNRHEADDATWEYSKTNGFTSRIDSGS